MSPSGLFVLRVRASDADLGDNARMTYSLEGNALPIWSLRKESTFLFAYSMSLSILCVKPG